VNTTAGLIAITVSDWNDLNIPTTSIGFGVGTKDVGCILPGTTLALQEWDAGTPAWGVSGFYAQAGIFFEPSIPRSSLNLYESYPRIVDASVNLPSPIGVDDWLREVGVRNVQEYLSPPAPATDPLGVTFEVRRIRRFHDVGELNQDVSSLRYVYEIRRGRLTEYEVTSQQLGIVSAQGFTMDWETTKPAGAPKAQDVWNDGVAYTGTNVGSFEEPDVNIHPGDLFRVLDEDGNLVEEVEISKVLGAGQLRLAAPGIKEIAPLSLVGMRFEIFLRRAPVPHEQTNEQLLSLITDQEILRTDATWGDATEKGGYVPIPTGVQTYDDVVNTLFDDLNADGSSGKTFGAYGVRKGDILIVDQAGTIPQIGGLPLTSEMGVRPLGDKGVLGRVDGAEASAYEAGGIDARDDNRGFYRVTQVVAPSTDPPHLLVNPINTFAGSVASPIIFDSADVERAYAVYPTVHDSDYPSVADEAQMALRPTRARDDVTKSFEDYSTGSAFYSLRPFSYRIIRPSQVFTDNAIDLILMARERMLSFIELFTRGIERKIGSYFVWQRDLHGWDLGNSTNPEAGLGLITNAYLQSISGRTDVMPYSNNESCLSLLDRRFWIYDLRLDSLTSDGDHWMRLINPLAAPAETAYTAYTDTVSGGSDVRPVLPERVEEVLDSSDRFRQIRYTWLAYRTHLTLGLLPAIQRFEAELPEKLEEQKQALLQRESMGNA